MRPVIVAFLLTIFAAPSFAQFKATQSKIPTAMPNFLICGPLSVWPPERDDDPVHLINVSPSYKYVEKSDSNGPLETLNVVHITVFGRTFVRSEQYIGDYLVQTSGKLEIVWKGSLKKNTAVKMTGRVWNDSGNNRWFYSELIEDNGRPRAKILAGCHASEGD